MKKRTEIKKNQTSLRIEITPCIEKVSFFGKIKTKIWNFILPPHIRLSIHEDNKD